MSEIVMPRLSDTMEEGTILRWLIADGEEVSRGQEIAEIETDKATMTYESDLAGTLTIVAAEGDTLPVGAVIARVGEAGDVDASATPESERVKASPLARRIAREANVDLHALTGSGPGGRIVKADVQAAAAGAAARVEQAPARAPASTPGMAERGERGPTPPPSAGLAGVSTAKGETTEIELSRTQQTIARRMAESKATIPHFTLQAGIDMSACAALRSELKRLSPGEAPTYNDMVVKACALALREHPRANSSYRDGRLQLHGRVNVGVAVAVEAREATTGGALVVPTLFDADAKSLGEIARETRALAGRVREGSITPPELGGGTFTVSNLGMFGVDAFTAIINPPQAAILAVGTARARPVVIDEETGEIGARPAMTITLACDHRILYGADAARFLARIRELLERPSALTL